MHAGKFYDWRLNVVLSRQQDELKKMEIYHLAIIRSDIQSEAMVENPYWSTCIYNGFYFVIQAPAQHNTQQNGISETWELALHFENAEIVCQC